jgi:PAS domain S-box-containing protein
MDDHDPVRAKLPDGDFSQPLALRSIGLITANFRSVVSADDAFLKLLDYSRHDLAAGLPTWERLVPHRDLQVVQTWLRAARTAGEARRAEQRLVRRFSETVLVRMGALWPAGEAAATCYVAQLGTEGETTATLNSAHAHLAALVESSHDAIISLSLDRRVLSWNPSAERQFGYTAAEMIGQDIILIFPDGRYHEKDDLFERLKRHGFFRHETQRKRKDGSVIDVELTIAPIRNNTHEMEAISVISRDITSLEAIIRDSETANEIIEDQAIQLDAIVDALRSLWSSSIARVGHCGLMRRRDSSLAFKPMRRLRVRMRRCRARFKFATATVARSARMFCRRGGPWRVSWSRPRSNG